MASGSRGSAVGSFSADPSETTTRLRVEGVEGDLQQRRHQMCIRLAGLRAESEKTRNDLMATETQIHSLLAAQHAIQLNVDGGIDMQPSTAEQLECELNASMDAYTEAFSYFVLNANLISVSAKLQTIVRGCRRSCARLAPFYLTAHF